MKMIRSKIAALVTTVFASVLLSVSCTNNLVSSNSALSTEYGSIIINGSDAINRSTDVSDITTATITVTGYGMNTVTKTDVAISGGAANGVEVTNIPVGKNRVVTVTANTGTVIRGVTDVSAGENNNCEVKWSTTAIANVYHYLLSDSADITNITSDSFSAKIPEVHAALFDAETFASDFKSAGFSSAALVADNYILDYGTVSVTSSNASGYKLQVTDNASSKVIFSDTADATLKALPGKWKARVFDSTGAQVAEKDITVVSGETSTVDVTYSEGGTITDKIVVYSAKSLGYLNMYVWNTTNASINSKHINMTESGDDYYGEIAATSCSIIMTKQNNGWNSQTGNLAIESAGAWRFNGSSFVTEEVSSEPTLTLTVNSAVDPNAGAKIYVSATSAPKIWIWQDGGKACTSLMGYDYDNSMPSMTAASDLKWNDGWYKFVVPVAYYTEGKDFTVRLNKNESSQYTVSIDEAIWIDDAGLVGTAGETYTADPTEVPAPVAPTVSISPKNGKEVGPADSIVVTFNYGNDEENFSASVTINGTTYTRGTDFNGATFSRSISNLSLSNGATINVSATCSNSVAVDVSDSATLTYNENKAEDPFTWDNVNCYFVLTDRFYNGVGGNDHSYYRQNASNNATLSSGYNNVATFHGGDIAGLTAKMDYFKKLGVNAIWITAPYEQAHGWCTGGGNGFPHYAFHGYYTQDWTYMDQNMGTIEEFRTFVNTCHANGIRVVMDVVMNHTGYNTVEDMITYQFGNYSLITKGHGWCENTGSWSANPDATNENGYWSGDNWNLWWGQWIRSFNYSNCTTGNGDWDACGNSGLPDVRSEMTDIVDIPTFLQNKWRDEPDSTTVPAVTGNTLGNTYGAYKLPSVSDVDWWDKSGDWRENKKGCPVEYQIIWLSGWVREFGVDGFRCDTAKHVQPKYWGMLKDACEDALAKWREDNDRTGDSVAKDWDEGFWTTGECFTYYNANGGRSDSTYFGTNDQGKFDSMINFTMNSNHSTPTNSTYPTTEDWGTYAATYAANVDTDGNGNRDNSLMYLSSHDTSLCRPGNQYDVGTKFVLLPGGIQIYYGDESLRGSAFTDCGDNDMTTRGDMNWSDGSIAGSASNGTSNDALVSHWGKLGNFRKHNPAVGAGVQTVSDTSYKRTYSGAAGENKVAIGINGTSVDVSGLWENGTTVYNWYDGESATVTGGSVTFAGGTSTQPILVSDKNPATYGITF